MSNNVIDLPKVRSDLEKRGTPFIPTLLQSAEPGKVMFVKFDQLGRDIEYSINFLFEYAQRFSIPIEVDEEAGIGKDIIEDNDTEDEKEIVLLWDLGDFGGKALFLGDDEEIWALVNMKVDEEVQTVYIRVGLEETSDHFIYAVLIPRIRNLVERLYVVVNDFIDSYSDYDDIDDDPDDDPIS